MSSTKDSGRSVGRWVDGVVLQDPKLGRIFSGESPQFWAVLQSSVVDGGVLFDKRPQNNAFRLTRKSTVSVDCGFLRR